jgi:hypothetical protein
MSLVNDLKINILLNTKAPTVKGFGRSLLFSKRTAAGAPAGLIGTSRVYSEAAEMIADGYTVNDPEYKIVSKYQSQEVKSADLVVYTGDDANPEEVLLNDAKSQIDCYGLLNTSRIKADLQATGDWALANEKMFIGGTDDVTIGAARNNIREAYFLHTNNALFAEAGVSGLCFPQDIGSITWKWQEPAGMIAAAFTATQLNTIKTNNCQTFESVGGYVMSNNGITTGGQFIDIIMIRDLIYARLFEALIFEFRGGKVSLDNPGLMRIEAVMRNVFGLIGKAGIIAPVVTEKDKVNSDMGAYQYMLTIPDYNDIATADIALRKATGIKAKVRASGKMHSVDIGIEIFV